MVATMETSSTRTAPPVSRESWDRFAVLDGYRAEIVRGELVVSPLPGTEHQFAVFELGVVMRATMPPEHMVLPGVNWRLDQRAVVAQDPQPDLVVMRRSIRKVVDPPLLAVEVISPSDHRKLEFVDLTRIEGKRLDFAQNGLADYLEVDLLENRREVRRYELIDGVLTVVDTAKDDEVLEATRPFAYAIRPVDLVQ